MNAVQRSFRWAVPATPQERAAAGSAARSCCCPGQRLDRLSLRNDPRLRAPAAPFHIGFLA